MNSQIIFNKDTKIIQWGKDSFSKMVPGKLDSHMRMKEAAPSPYTIYKNLLKLDQRPKCMS